MTPERGSCLFVVQTQPDRQRRLNDETHYIINTFNCLIMTNFNGTV